MKSVSCSTRLSLYSLIGVLALLYSAEGAKIFIFPLNINSHSMYFARLGEVLADLGHVVDIYLAQNNHAVKSTTSKDNFTVLTYSTKRETAFFNSPEMSKTLVNLALSKSEFEEFKIMYNLWEKGVSELTADCSDLLGNESLMKNIRSAKYDFAITEFAAIECLAVIPYSLDIPYAVLGVSIYGWMYRVPALPSFVSILGFGDTMTFTERLTTFLLEAAQVAAFYFGPPNKSCIKYAPHKPALNVLELFARSSLWLIMEDISLGFPVPHMPNTVSVGDIMAGQPVKPVPALLDKFLTDSPDGVIIVSFGSFFDYVPQNIVEKFCNVFRSLKYGVIWKLRAVDKTSEGSSCRDVSNVLTMDWIPQNDLLAHEKVLMFLTHGGLNSMVETIYHSKPVIVFPIALDQKSNAFAAESKGFGITMQLADFS